MTDKPGARFRQWRSFKLAILIYPLALFAITSDIRGQEWRIVNPSATFSSPRSLSGFELLLMWVGENGSVGTSQDGGKSWDTKTVGSSSLNAVHVIDANRAIIGGDNGTVKLTTNGGGDWIGLNSTLTDNILSASGSGDRIILTTSSGFVATYNGVNLALGQVTDKPIYASAVRGDTSIAIANTGKVFLRVADAEWKEVSTVEGAIARQIIFYDGQWWVAGESWTLYSSQDLTKWIKHDVIPANSQLATTRVRLGVVADGQLAAFTSDELMVLSRAYVLEGQSWKLIAENPYYPANSLQSIYQGASKMYSATLEGVYAVESFTKLFDQLYAKMWRSYAAVDIQPNGMGYAVGALVDPNQEGFAQYHSFIERTTDGGNTWLVVHLHESDIRVRSVAALQSGWVIVGADSGRYLLSQDGVAWTQHSVQSDKAIKFVGATESGKVFAIVHPNVVYQSNDMGESLLRIANQPSTSGLFDFELSPSGELKVLETKALQISTNDGQTWKTQSLDYPMFAFAAQSDTVYLAGTASNQTSLFRSVDGGQNLQSVHTMSVALKVFDLATKNDGNVVAVADGSWVLQSTDNGLTWAEKRLRNSPEFLGSVTASPSGFIAVGNTGSMWALMLPKADVTEISILTHGVYPNPTSGSVHLGDKVQFRSARVIDMLGRVLIDLPEIHSETLDLGALMPGSYVMILENSSETRRVKIQKH